MIQNYVQQGRRHVNCKCVDFRAMLVAGNNREEDKIIVSRKKKDCHKMFTIKEQ